MTTSDVLTADGIDLLPTSGWCWAEDLSSMLAGPAPRGGNLLVPRLHGEQRTALKRYGAVEFDLPFGVLGVDRTTGDPVDDGHRQLHQNIAVLRRAFARTGVQLVHSFGGQDERVASVDPAGTAVTARRERSHPPYAQVTIPLRLPSAFWSDIAPVSQPLAGATGTPVTMTQFAAADAPITDATVVFPGPISNPELRHAGRYWRYQGNILSGRSLAVDFGAERVTAGPGDSWTPLVTNVRWGGGYGWFEIDPNQRPFTITLIHTGGGSANATLTGRRKYLAP